MFAILAQSTLASVNNEKDNIVPESKDNEPVEFTNKIMRGLEFLATKVAKQHHVSKAQAEAAVQVESDVDDSMLARNAGSEHGSPADHGALSAPTLNAYHGADSTVPKQDFDHAGELISSGSTPSDKCKPQSPDGGVTTREIG